MSETMFIDLNTRLLIIGILIIIAISLMYIAFYKKPTRTKK